MAKFDSEFRNDLGYHQTRARRAGQRGPDGRGHRRDAEQIRRPPETPVYIAENCTQCMECITASPDTALPNTAQDISTILVTAVRNYVTDKEQQKNLLNEVKGLEDRCRARMINNTNNKGKEPFKDILRSEVDQLVTISEKARDEFPQIIDQLPLAYNDVTAIFRSVEKKTPG
ncbi:MAG: hypothetical protein CM1200mP29_06020 [Verrucomicrobiota bacterium]|nr:MAG: hypothetical protein CM1200mP29_06020 [Verrucomicrobiota bacterium]